MNGSFVENELDIYMIQNKMAYMRLNLPLNLYRVVLAACASLCATTVQAGVMHADIALKTYTDFGQNDGRYVTAPHVSSVLAAIRKRDGGVLIPYTGGQASWLMPYDMIDYSSACDGGYAVALGTNWLATVDHNGSINPSFCAWEFGNGNAMTYQCAEYRYSTEFKHKSPTDYKVLRLSKIFTDITPSVTFSNPELLAGEDGKWLVGQRVYRTGGGTMYVSDYRGEYTRLGPGTYQTGGIMEVGNAGVSAEDSSFSLSTTLKPGADSINDANPLPFMGQAGDSGSPVWIYNTETQRYEFLASMAAIGGTNSYIKGDIEFTESVQQMYNRSVAFDRTNSVTIHASVTPGTAEDDTLSDPSYNVTATKWYGSIETDDGQRIDYVGVKRNDDGSVINTWCNLRPLLDTDNWYAYGDSYLNANDNATGGKELTRADLYSSSNLIFTGGAQAEPLNIVVDEQVELGFGYAQFSRGENSPQTVDFVMSGSGMLSSAGFVVDEGVSLHLRLTGESDYAREWRKNGAGDLYIEGSGDNNNILLNIGGSGTTYLQRENGYAAYNVLASTGSRVVISDVGQILRDITLGNDGGTLDMNGCSMVWNNGADATTNRDAFTIHALDECALITNSNAERTTTLTWQQGGEQRWLGSFSDAEGGALQFVYDGGEGARLVWSSLHSELSTQEASGITVSSGTLSLTGSLTEHGRGSESGTTPNRLVLADDWHYSDATANVQVENGATFELGSHARLSGDVRVADGGSFVMREGVQHRYEYVEGGLEREDTDQYRDYIGLKGNVALEGAGATMRVAFSSETDAAQRYDGNITGSGHFEADLGNNQLILNGKLTLTGSMSVLSGGVILGQRVDAAGIAGGDSSRWTIGERGYIVFAEEDQAAGAQHLLSLISEDSRGALALSRDYDEQIIRDGLYVGAAEGSTVQYGTLGTNEALATTTLGERQVWLLGGGGGTLMVNYRLTGDADLEIGNAYTNSEVYLTNTGNDFTGAIHLNGIVTLDFAEGALGSSRVTVNYGQTIMSIAELATMLSTHLDTGSGGVLMLDRSTASESIDLSRFSSLSLGAKQEARLAADTSISLGEDRIYRFGGTGLLHVDKALGDTAEGASSLELDAQGYTGGVIELNSALTLTGSVRVMGWDGAEEHSAEADGSITLQLASNAALDSAASVEAARGGVIELAAGTMHSWDFLQTSEGGHITGASATLSLQQGDIDGGLDVGYVVKNGDGVLKLGGDNAYGMMVVAAGELQLSSDNGLSAGGFTQIEAGATLNHIRTAEDGSQVFSSSSGWVMLNGTEENAAVIKVGNNTLNEIIYVNGYGRIDGSSNAGQFTVVKGALEVGADSVLELRSSGYYNVVNEKVNSSAGIIRLQAGTLRLDNLNQSIDGTLQLAEAGQSTTLNIYSNSNNVTKDINRIELGGGVLNMTHHSWNSVVTIGSLGGSGTINWNNNCNHWFSNRIILQGEGDFVGTFNMRATYNNADRAYQKYMQLNHDLALQHAVLNASGGSNTAWASLAVNTENLRLKGLQSNAYVHLYAGQAIVGAGQDVGKLLAQAPISTRSATLVLDTDEGCSYSYEGVVAAKSDGSAAFSLVKQGLGSQSFSGETAWESIRAEQGSLRFGGDLSATELHIGAGAELAAYSGAGTTPADEATVSVQSGRLSCEAGAVLNANLDLSGSTLSMAEGGLAMGSTLTLGRGEKANTLDAETYAELFAQNATATYECVLFSGVDAIDIGNGLSTASFRIDAGDYFTNLSTGSGYTLSYDGAESEGGSGTVSLMYHSVPEPATGTLSLLALSLLCLRRRR